jgi:hypothetical protein
LKLSQLEIEVVDGFFFLLNGRLKLKNLFLILVVNERGQTLIEPLFEAFELG